VISPVDCVLVPDPDACSDRGAKGLIPGPESPVCSLSVCDRGGPPSWLIYSCDERFTSWRQQWLVEYRVVFREKEDVQR